MLIAHTTDVPQSEQQAVCSKFEQAILDAGVVSQNLDCRMHEGCLSIHGTVQNYRQKQSAQEAVRQLPGVLEISNQLQISPSSK